MHCVSRFAGDLRLALSLNGFVRLSQTAAVIVAAWLCCGSGPAIVRAADRDPAEIRREQLAWFESRIRPVLLARCVSCHGEDPADIQGGLRVDQPDGLLAGGDSGPAVIAGDAAGSLLIQKIREPDPALRMPTGQAPLDEAVIRDFEQWIAGGAVIPTAAELSAAASTDGNASGTNPPQLLGWAFRPRIDPPVPAVQHNGWVRNPIDAFILARQEAAGLSPGPPATRIALVRRISYDLTGLPPEPALVDEFVADNRPEAVAALVDRLLEQPEYGERWARHWMDVIRYSDTAGDNSDFPIPQMYRYRNWLIDAIQSDMPFDQFVRQQLAGDLLPADTPEQAYQQQIATGYLANARRFGSRVDDYPHHLTIEDTLDNLGRAFLGLSITCARCHNHKFDPLTTEDYYGLYGFFSSTRYPWPGIELEQRQRDLVPLTAPEVATAAMAAHEQRQHELDETVKRLEAERNAAEGAARASLEEQVKRAQETAKRHHKRLPDLPWAYAVTDAAERNDAAVQLRGNPEKTGDVVRRRFPRVLGGFTLPDDDATSGRRQLAEWIVDPANPLTARVTVNRVWAQHFGRGIVPTPNDFGRQGQPPTHPELLDWLASRFIESGWSLKQLHRLILTSQTYQLATVQTLATREADPLNELLTAFRTRRLDAEAIRDTLLSHGGSLDRIRPEGHPFPAAETWGFTQHNPFKAVYETNHRSVYLMTQRIQRHPFLAIFDGADPAASTPQRLISTSPLQALFFLNNPLVLEQSAQCARRTWSEQPTVEARIEELYRRLFSRRPDRDELAECQSFLQSTRGRLADGSAADSAAGWELLVRALWLTNEFVYLD